MRHSQEASTNLPCQHLFDSACWLSARGRLSNGHRQPERTERRILRGAPAVRLPAIGRPSQVTLLVRWSRREGSPGQIRRSSVTSPGFCGLAVMPSGASRGARRPAGRERQRSPAARTSWRRGRPRQGRLETHTGSYPRRPRCPRRPRVLSREMLDTAVPLHGLQVPLCGSFVTQRLRASVAGPGLALVEVSVVEQRYREVLEVLAKVPVTEVAARFGVSRQSVRAWVRSGVRPGSPTSSDD